MATRYPGDLDRDPNELPDNVADSDTLDSPNHATIHNNVNGAVLQIEEKLGIGDTTASAGAVLHGTAAGTSAWTTDPSIVGSLSVAKDSADAVINLTAHHDTEATAAELTLRKSDGSKASPALVDDDAVLGKVMFQGYDGNSWATGAVIQALVDGTAADGDMPTELLFQVTPDGGSETPATALTISPAKKATFAGAVEIDGATDLDGVVQIDNTVTVGVDDTGHDVKFFGATAGKYMEWDESADQLDVTGTFDVTGNTSMVGTLTVGVNDTGHDVKFFGATDGNYMEWDESDDHLNVKGQVYIGTAVDNIANLGSVSLACGSDSDVTPSDSHWNGHFTIDGSGYKGGISLDGDAMWLGHDSASRDIYFAIDGVKKAGVNSSGRFVVYGNHSFSIQSSSATGREIIEFRSGSSLTSGAGYNIYADGDSSHPSKHIFFCDSSSSELLIQSTGVTISGSLSKGSGSFNIPHPTKGGDWRLRHSFIEGPTADNIYRGTATISGSSVSIDLDAVSGMTDGTWLALNTNPWALVASSGNAVTWELSGKTLTITGPDGAVCSWMVIGERKDPTMIASDISDSNGKLVVEYEDANYVVTIEEEE